MKTWIAVLLALAWTGCRRQAPAPEASRFTAEQLAARFYYDLGPETVDVAGYPAEQKKNYQVFARVCSQCHTPARPLNAPIVSAQDWERYVRRMHERAKTREKWISVPEESFAEIVDFLAYDAKVRKVQGKAEFDRRTEALKRLFDEVGAERARLQLAEGEREARPAPPYAGDKPAGGE